MELFQLSEMAIIQMQDYLDLGGEARMNFPGICDGTNWVWRAKEGFASHELAQRIRAMTALYGRLPE